MYKLVLISLFLFLATSCSKTGYTIHYSKSNACPSRFPYEVKYYGEDIGCVTCEKALLEELSKLKGGKYKINPLTKRVYEVKKKH